MKNCGGRPLTDINWDFVGQMLEKGAEGTEIAAYYGVHPDTLYKRCEAELMKGFSEFRRQKKSSGNFNIRAKQYDVAMSGDRSMLIWLGKQRLGQREEAKIDHNVVVQTIDYSNATCTETDSSSQVCSEELSIECSESSGSGC